MVDITNFDQVSGLASERQSIINALDAFDAGARIVDMTISGPNTAPPNALVMINTSHMDYPAGMIDGIKKELDQRLQEISDELTGLGISGASAR